MIKIKNVKLCYHYLHLLSPEPDLTPVWMTLVSRMAPFPFPLTTRAVLWPRGCCWQVRPPMDLSELLLTSWHVSCSSKLAVFSCSTSLSVRGSCCCCWCCCCGSLSLLESVGDDGLEEGDELEEHLEGVAPDLNDKKLFFNMNQCCRN